MIRWLLKGLLKWLRGGELTLLSLNPPPAPAAGEWAKRLMSALARLEIINPRAALVVKLRFLRGMSFEEIAIETKVGPRTVKRDWNIARAWLYSEMQ